MQRDWLKLTSLIIFRPSCENKPKYLTSVFTQWKVCKISVKPDHFWSLQAAQKSWWTHRQTDTQTFSDSSSTKVENWFFQDFKISGYFWNWSFTTRGSSWSNLRFHLLDFSAFSFRFVDVYLARPDLQLRIKLTTNSGMEL